VGVCADAGRNLAAVRSALDVETGGGEVVDEAAVLPARMVVTEAWSPNVARAYRRLTLAA
jgi:hypothetical protein